MDAIFTSAVLGSIVTLVAQLIKKYFGTNTILTYAVVAVLSLFVGYLYSIVAKDPQLLAVVVQVFMYAGAIYTFIISKLPGASINS